jgi:hypothetical protein
MPMDSLSCNEKGVFTGAENAEIEWWSYQGARVGFLVGGGEPSVVNALPLEGHRLAAELKPRKRLIFRALERMAVTEPERLHSVLSWTSLVIWMERKIGSVTTLLTSATFPKFPHCTFLTDKSFRHIPPNSIASWDSDYALRENLYHESLHQELSALLLHRDILSEKYSAKTAPKIPIPWRGAAWEPDRAFHAIYVYSGLLPMRMQELSTHKPTSKPFVWTMQALNDGANVLKYLIDKLDGLSNVFTTQGQVVYDAIRTHALKTLADTQGMSLSSKGQGT